VWEPDALEVLTAARDHDPALIDAADAPWPDRVWVDEVRADLDLPPAQRAIVARHIRAYWRGVAYRYVAWALSGFKSRAYWQATMNLRRVLIAYWYGERRSMRAITTFGR